MSNAVFFNLASSEVPAVVFKIEVSLWALWFQFRGLWLGQVTPQAILILGASLENAPRRNRMFPSTMVTFTLGK